MEQKPKVNPAIAAIIVIVLVGIVASVVIVVNANKDGAGTSTTTSGTTDSTNTATVDSTDTSTYKDGTYTATGSYISPGGRESLDITVTIKDGVITDTSMVAHAASSESRQYQGLFSDNYKELIVGKKIAGISLSRVAGSSLTSNGFNDAINEIRNDAKA